MSCDYKYLTLSCGYFGQLPSPASLNSTIFIFDISGPITLINQFNRDKCPAFLHNLFSGFVSNFFLMFLLKTYYLFWMHAGKEGFPSIAYEMHCDHSGFITHVCAGVYGACNDKTIVRFDGFIQLLRAGKKYAHVGFKLFAVIGGAIVAVVHTGVYAICDGGYHMWKCTMSALSLSTTYFLPPPPPPHFRFRINVAILFQN